MVSQITPDKFFTTVTKMASLNRYSFGNGNKEARDWIMNEIKGLGNIKVETEQFNNRGPAYNIIATLKGTDNSTDFYIFGAHYDSLPTATASPGAEDDGSGSSGLLELAKIFSKYPPKKTIQFIWYSGEEQGLIGSTASASNLVTRGDRDNLKLMINMDMIGYIRDANQLKVLIETHRRYSQTVELFQKLAVQYCDKLSTAVSYNPFGSDHVPYINRNMQAILTIDNDWSRYPHYHRSTDTPQYLVPKMGSEILKLNLAVVATLIGY